MFPGWDGGAEGPRSRARLVEHFGDRRSDDGSFVPSFEPLQILLGEDAFARRIRHRDAANAERRQHRACRLFDMSQLPRPEAAAAVLAAFKLCVQGSNLDKVSAYLRENFTGRKFDRACVNRMGVAL